MNALVWQAVRTYLDAVRSGDLLMIPIMRRQLGIIALLWPEYNANNQGWRYGR